MKRKILKNKVKRHQKIKKIRAKARKQILEGIQEFDERYDEDIELYEE